jgi:ABC-type branched-subunit amino acid transport system substrate-binding protein
VSRGRAACACALLAAVIGGCTANGGANSSVTITGKSLTIYVSDARTDQPQVAQDVFDAERLAFQQSPTRVNGFTLRMVILHGAISDNARAAIQDKSAIAYLGEIVPHSSSASLGITNALDLLQVSPTDTALELTQASPAVPGSPDVYYESLSTYKRTFARVVPNAAREAKAQVQEMQALGVTKLYVRDDGSPYGAAIASALRHDLSGAISLSATLAGADGAFYGAASPARAARFFNGAALTTPSLKLFGPSALADQSLAADLTPSVRNLYVSAPGFSTQELTPAGSKFVSDFTAAYGHAPVPQAIFGYEAMAAVLAVVREAGAQANNRTTVVQDFLSLKRSQSVLGPYAIDSNGDTNIAPFVFSRPQGGKLVPVKFLQLSG